MMMLTRWIEEAFKIITESLQSDYINKGL